MTKNKEREREGEGVLENLKKKRVWEMEVKRKTEEDYEDLLIKNTQNDDSRWYSTNLMVVP